MLAGDRGGGGLLDHQEGQRDRLLSPPQSDRQVDRKDGVLHRQHCRFHRRSGGATGRNKEGRKARKIKDTSTRPGGKVQLEQSKEGKILRGSRDQPATGSSKVRLISK